jgi:putative SOS response-associated peptidase YedK
MTGRFRLGWDLVPWHGTRGTKKNPVEGGHTLFGFLTTAANATVKAVRAEAMPAILTPHEEMDQWMSAPTAEALRGRCAKALATTMQ